MSQPMLVSRRLNISRKSGFTLMELLVVIAIIAVLISFLLPALSQARRESNKAKCLAALRDLGQAFNIYATEFKQTFPVVRHAAANSAVEGGPGLLPNGNERHWTDLIAKYAGSKVNLEDMTKPLPGGAMPTQVYENTWRLKDGKSVIWGCPEWQGGGLWDKNEDGTDNTYQVGYGMNPYAIPQDFIKGTGAVRHNSLAWISTRSTGVFGAYHKSTQWGKKSADRLLLADSQVYYILAPLTFNRSTTTWQGYSQPSNLRYQPASQINFFANTTNFVIDGGRHLRQGTKRDAHLGNRGLNVLFADFHATTVSIPEAWAAVMNPGTTPP